MSYYDDGRIPRSNGVWVVMWFLVYVVFAIFVLPHIGCEITWK